VTHFDFQLKFIGIALDEFSKINPRFSGIEKDCFASVSLDFNV
jgi:hypothetical protein